MSDLKERLERLGLSQYLDSFTAEGFESWEIVLDITESDLSSLNVKLGHRRKLQRAIAEFRGQSSERPLPIGLNKAGSVDGSYRSGDESGVESRIKNESAAVGPTTSTKRKYRRHPKPDEHAPERPPSAYVIFSNQVRETLKGQELSFTEIAKVVGERWQVLPADEREACERQANGAKEKYYSMLAEYKKTPQFEAYQRYLEDFKAKHAAPQKEGKRSKLETETTTSTQSSGQELIPQQPGPPVRRVSTVQDQQPGHYRSESSPPVGPQRLPSGPSHPSKSNSPAGHSLSGFNSPRMSEHYSPISTSPRSATLHKEGSFESYPSAVARDARGHSDNSLPYASSAYGPTQHQSSSSTTPPIAGYSTHYQPVELPSRRSMRDMPPLPPLSREDTTLSSDSGGQGQGQGQGQQSGYNRSYSNTPHTMLPVLDVPKNMRMLPAPVPSMGATPSLLDRPLQPVANPPQPHMQTQQPHVLQHPPAEYRTNASLAALLRAGELARVADDEEMDMDKESSP
ncbi:hypothetical protein P280DRAFT_547097 [Massarina eburnea CBS 473.64]|uniref:HMG box domain-containing protein n=1 Tax=Massarina eburnea CBS 473.64 TaxID=1395130 RepID=A0A6A6SAR6_9PLEO|nr:hypothetical protein P280DRAFT_547097 [Massarina eburnea CBS 473.64]